MRLCVDSKVKGIKMEVKNVIGDNSPEVFEKLQGGTLINVQIEEVVTEGVVKYKYKQAFTTETNDEKLEKVTKTILIQIANQYLASTGWYVERLNDPSSGKAIPEDVVLKRAEARELINILEAELILLEGDN